jgi:hypothetical protein
MPSFTPKYFVLRPEEFRDARTLTLAGQFAPWIRQLAVSPNLRKVTHLSLRCNDLNPVTLVETLVGSPHLGGLTALSLRGCNISAGAVAVLAGAPLLARLTALDLGGDTTGAAGLRALLGSPYLRELSDLDVSGGHAMRQDWVGGYTTYSNIDDEGALALGASPAAARLTRLNLAWNDIRDDTFRAIIVSPHLANLGGLNVFETGMHELSIGAAVVEALKVRFGEGMSFQAEG